MTKKRNNNIRENISSPYMNTNDNVNEWLNSDPNERFGGVGIERETRYWPKDKGNAVLTSEREEILNNNMDKVVDTGELVVYKPYGQDEDCPHITAGMVYSEGGSEFNTQYRQTHITTMKLNEHGKETKTWKGLSDSDLSEWMNVHNIEGDEFRNIRDAFKETKDKEENEEWKKNLCQLEQSESEEGISSWLSNPNNIWNYQEEYGYYQEQPPKTP